MNSQRLTLSVAMIARNEEAILERTLESVRWADEIVIVDSGSTDRTPEIARSCGARHIFHRDFRGHAEQKNIAIGHCRSDWILLLDADECVSQDLAVEIQAVLQEPSYEAYWIPRLNLFMTRWLRHGGFYPDEKLRLFRRGSARVEEGVGPHGTPQFKGAAGRLNKDLLHYAYPSFSAYLEHMNRYSSEAADVLVARGEASRSVLRLLVMAFLNPALTFVKNYILRQGFRDGVQGLILHVNHSFYVHWKYVKAWAGVALAKDGLVSEATSNDVTSGLRARPPEVREGIR